MADRNDYTHNLKLVRNELYSGSSSLDVVDEYVTGLESASSDYAALVSNIQAVLDSEDTDEDKVAAIDALLNPEE